MHSPRPNSLAYRGPLSVSDSQPTQRQLVPELVAEGVKTVSKLDDLKSHTCDSFQGYYFARPLPNGAFIDYCRQFMPVPRKKSSKSID